MDDSQKNVLPLEKYETGRKIVSQLEKCVTVTKMCYRKMCHSHKNVSHLEKCARVTKIDYSQKNVSQSQKWVTVRKIGHSWKNV